MESIMAGIQVANRGGSVAAKGIEDAVQAGKNGMPLAGSKESGKKHPKKHSSRKSSRK